MSTVWRVGCVMNTVDVWVVLWTLWRVGCVMHTVWVALCYEHCVSCVVLWTLCELRCVMNTVWRVGVKNSVTCGLHYEHCARYLNWKRAGSHDPVFTAVLPMICLCSSLCFRLGVGIYRGFCEMASTWGRSRVDLLITIRLLMLLLLLQQQLVTYIKIQQTPILVYSSKGRKARLT